MDQALAWKMVVDAKCTDYEKSKSPFVSEGVRSTPQGVWGKCYKAAGPDGLHLRLEATDGSDVSGV